MAALDLIKPSVCAVRLIASLHPDMKKQLKLGKHINCLGLITADSDDVTYIAADEATKQAQVEVVFGHSLYAGAANGPSPTAGEVIIMLGGSTPAEVRSGLCQRAEGQDCRRGQGQARGGSQGQARSRDRQELQCE